MTVNLPFEIGDKIYKNCVFGADERVVDSVAIDKEGIVVYVTYSTLLGNMIESFVYDKDWGETYFSSKDEAEQYRLNRD